MADPFVTLDVINKARQVCMETSQLMNGAAQKLDMRYKDAERDWGDKQKYRQLGDKIDECKGALRGPIEDLLRHASTLTAMADEIAKYHNIAPPL